MNAVRERPATPDAPETLPTRPLALAEAILTTLTNRQMEVARGIVRGETPRETARRLGMSVKTYDTHRGAALRRLGTRNNVTMTRKFVRAGLEDPYDWEDPSGDGGST